uniref:(California timema) hypothetical protein n=1 Tax=Timema californicum TaxID=61474 RepID=A0A7R9JEP9_TIMCA|nr:unnamed protein product [Timema californicum]
MLASSKPITRFPPHGCELFAKVQLIPTSPALTEMFDTGEPIKSKNQPYRISAHALSSQKQADSFIGRYLMALSRNVRRNRGALLTCVGCQCVSVCMCSLSVCQGNLPQERTQQPNNGRAFAGRLFRWELAN